MDRKRAARAFACKSAETRNRLYRARDFEDAAKAFGEALRLNPQDRPSRLYVSRCWNMQARPPAADWLGVSETAG
ncbi:MAG: hypothetical protein EXQ88_01215 [Alphaproteobacteria bacterium]|nr:hypothetical protein [Alphaproteobacteria bacterium]